MSEITNNFNHEDHEGSDEDADPPYNKDHQSEDESDEDADPPYNKDHQSEDESDEELGIDSKQNNKKDSNKTASGAITMIDTFDRPGDATAKGLYAQSGAYATGSKNKPGERIPKAGYYAEAGVGRAQAEYSVFHADAKGPNASFGAEASVIGVGAMARAEIASASANAGPVCVKLGLGLDTGASIGLDGLQAKFLGTGFSIGPKTGVAVLGTEVSCSVM